MNEVERGYLEEKLQAALKTERKKKKNRLKKGARTMEKKHNGWLPLSDERGQNCPVKAQEKNREPPGASNHGH